MIRAEGPGGRGWVMLLALGVALTGACSPSGEAEPVVASATARSGAESLVAELLGAEATEADLAVFADAYADGGTCALDTEESVRLGATYYRRLSEAVVAVGRMDVPTLAAVARVLRDEYDAVASGVEMVPLPTGFAALEVDPWDNDRPVAEYKDALRGMLEPYGVGLYVPDPGDATVTDSFLPLDLSNSEQVGFAKVVMVEIMRGFATLPADAVRAVDFDVYVGDVVVTVDGENEAGGYARLRDDGRGVMAIDGTAGQNARAAVPHEWAHLLVKDCGAEKWGDVYFDAHYPVQLPSYWASETLAEVPPEGGPYDLVTFELPVGPVTTAENLWGEVLPDGVAVVELTNYALRDGEGFPVHMEVVTAPPWGASQLGSGGVPATEYLQETPTIARHLAVTAARLDAVAPGAGEMGVIAMMLQVLTNHASLSNAGESPDAALWDDARTYAGHNPSAPATSQPPRD